MARHLASTDQFTATISFSSGSCTLAAWVNSDVVDLGAYPANVDRWITLGGVANDAFVIRRQNSNGDCYVNGAAGGRVTAGTVTAGARDHWCGTADGSTITLYKNGSSVGTASQTQAIGSQTTILIGRNDTEQYEGNFEEIGLWSRALSADEVLALSKGFTPAFFIRGLLEYWPLVRSLNGRRGANLTDAGSSTVVSHGRVFQPSSSGALFVPTVSSAGGPFPHYTRRPQTGGLIALG